MCLLLQYILDLNIFLVFQSYLMGKSIHAWSCRNIAIMLYCHTWDLTLFCGDTVLTLFFLLIFSRAPKELLGLFSPEISK